MKSIFFIYWIWYLSYLFISMSDFVFDMIIIRILGMNSFLTFAFVCIAPLYYIIYHNKGNKSDQKYLNACLHCSLIRLVVWCFAYYGMTDNKIILAINCFGMFVFILIESKLKQIDKSYFNY